VDNIGSTAGLVVTGVRRSHRWWPDSHSSGRSCDRVDIQPGGWPTHGLKRALAALVIHYLVSRWQGTNAAPNGGLPISLNRKIIVPDTMAAQRAFFPEMIAAPAAIRIAPEK
jgi:hypothetical protein